MAEVSGQWSALIIRVVVSKAHLFYRVLWPHPLK